MKKLDNSLKHFDENLRNYANFFLAIPLPLWYLVTNCLPVPRIFFISGLEDFIPNLIFGSKILCEKFKQSMDFFKFFIFHHFSDQKVVKSRLFLARKKSPPGAQTPDLRFHAWMC